MLVLNGEELPLTVTKNIKGAPSHSHLAQSRPKFDRDHAHLVDENSSALTMNLGMKLSQNGNAPTVASRYMGKGQDVNIPSALF